MQKNFMGGKIGVLLVCTLLVWKRSRQCISRFQLSSVSPLGLLVVQWQDPVLLPWPGFKSQAADPATEEVTLSASPKPGLNGKYCIRAGNGIKSHARSKHVDQMIPCGDPEQGEAEQ